MRKFPSPSGNYFTLTEHQVALEAHCPRLVVSPRWCPSGSRPEQETYTRNLPLRNPQYFSLIFKECWNISGECLNNILMNTLRQFFLEHRTPSLTTFEAAQHIPIDNPCGYG